MPSKGGAANIFSLGSLAVSIIALIVAISTNNASWKATELAEDHPHFEFSRSGQSLTVHQFGGTTFDPPLLRFSCEYEDDNGHIFRTSAAELTLTRNTVSDPGGQVKYLPAYTASGMGQHIADSGCDEGVLVRLLISSVGEREWVEVMTWREPE